MATVARPSPFFLSRWKEEGRRAVARYFFLGGGLLLLASRSIRLTRSLGSGSAAISSYIACSCFCSHISKGRSVGSFTFLSRAASAARSFCGLLSFAMAHCAWNEEPSTDSPPRHTSLPERMPIFNSHVHAGLWERGQRSWMRASV